MHTSTLFRSAAITVGLSLFALGLSFMRVQTAFADTSVPPALASLPGQYDMGNPTLRNIWIDPVHGEDTNSGATRTQALKTVDAAWRSIPANVAPTTGYRFLLTRGTYGWDNLPNFWDERVGTAEYPIIVQSVDGPGAAMLQRDINSKGLKYFYLLGVNITPAPASDALHFEASDHILVRDSVLIGGNQGAHDVMKANQTQNIYVENNDIAGGDNNALGFVAVQYGHVINNKIHNAADWCFYAKGGSADLTVSGNEIYDCGTGGFSAGQGPGVQFMTPPFVHYEAYDIKFVNNVVHDTGTAGMGVNGGYNILLAYNTLYRAGVGHDTHQADHMIEVNPGYRGCDGAADPSALADCRANKNVGAWSTLTATDEEQYIPSRNVYIYNNLVVNPAGSSAPNMLQIRGPVTPPSGSGLTGPQVVDANLQIKGNVFVDSGAVLGIDDSSGCQSSNATCNETQLNHDNQISGVSPSFVNAGAADFRLSAGSSPLFASTVFAIPNFPGGDRPASNIPVSDLTNTVTVDRSGVSRSSNNIVGAYALNASSPAPVAPPPSPAPTPVPVPVPAPVPSPTPSGGTPVVTSPIMPSPPVRLVPRPNLVGRWATLTRTCRRVRGREVCSLRGTFVIKNTGTQAAGASRFSIYRSSDAALNAGDALLRSYSIGTIGVNRSRTVAVSLLGLSTNPHPAYFIGVADALHQIIETSERDNASVNRQP